MQTITTDNDDFVKSEIIINDTKIRLKSVFSEKTNIDKAIKNIVIRKITFNKSG